MSEVITESNPKTTILENSNDKSRVLKVTAVTTALTTGAIAGRVALQGFPSIQPILAIAFATSFFYNWKQGAVIGVSAFYFSNFLVYGFHGPWTLFQCLGAGLAALTGTYLSKITKNKYVFFGGLTISVVLFELVMNISSVFYSFGILNLPAHFVAALPFAFLNLTSTLAFGAIFYGVKEELQKLYTR